MSASSFEFMWPCRGPITLAFGEMFQHKRHAGLDIGVQVGTPIVAGSPFEVFYLNNNPNNWADGYGMFVMLLHPGGWKTLYAHLSRVDVHLKDVGDCGQVIGLSGMTGNTTGPHVHVEVIDPAGGYRRDPLRYLISRCPGEINTPPHPEPPAQAFLQFALPMMPMICEADLLNVRNGPGLQYEVVGQLMFGEPIIATAASGDGLWVKHETGWSAALWHGDQYLDGEGDA